MAELVALDPAARDAARDAFDGHVTASEKPEKKPAKATATAAKTKAAAPLDAKEREKFRDYFAYAHRAQHVPPHAWLALRVSSAYFFSFNASFNASFNGSARDCRRRGKDVGALRVDGRRRYSHEPHKERSFLDNLELPQTVVMVVRARRERASRLRRSARALVRECRRQVSVEPRDAERTLRAVERPRAHTLSRRIVSPRPTNCARARPFSAGVRMSRR